MLETLPAETFRSVTYHLASYEHQVNVLRDMGVNAEGISDMVSMLRSRDVTDNVDDLVNGVFSPTRSYAPRKQTRFSDGNLPVFYTALERETAKAEIWHWYVKPLLEGGTRNWPLHFRYVSCNFDGRVKDLRPKLPDWPFLTSNDGYKQCNDLAEEASASGLDGMLTWSARVTSGTNLPVFKALALSKLSWAEKLTFVCDPATGIIVTVA